MKAKELIHGGLYLIHDTNDMIVRYDAVSHSFKSEWYEYTLSVFHDDLCATDGDRYIFVKPIPLTEDILEKNGWKLSLSCEFYTHKSGRNLKLSNLLGAPSISCFGKISILHYAHEFQHALRLCGQNDLAEDFKV